MQNWEFCCVFGIQFLILPKFTVACAYRRSAVVHSVALKLHINTNKIIRLENEMANYYYQTVCAVSCGDLLLMYRRHLIFRNLRSSVKKMPITEISCCIFCVCCLLSLLCSASHSASHFSSHLCCLVSLVSHVDEILQLSLGSSPDWSLAGSADGGQRIRGGPLARLLAPCRRLGPKNALPVCVAVAGLAGCRLRLSGSRRGAHAGGWKRGCCDYETHQVEFDLKKAGFNFVSHRKIALFSSLLCLR